MYIKSDKIYFENGIRSGYLVVEEGKIVDFLEYDASVDKLVDYTGFRIIPGTIDPHIHGTRGYGFNDYKPEAEAEVRGFQKACAANGITGVFPISRPSMQKAIAKVAREEPPNGARILGINNESPFGNRVGEKGSAKDTPTVDMSVVEEIYDNCDGLLRVMGIAPEVEGSYQILDFLKERGVKVSLAHTNATYEQATEAIEKGVTMGTHTGNAMRGIHHRDVGTFGACLLHEGVYCELVLDGIHVSREMIDIMFRVKDYDHWFLICDSNEVAYAPDGLYKLREDMHLYHNGNRVETPEGRIVGSAKSVLAAFPILIDDLNIPIEIVLKMSSLNVAKFYGFGETKGSIKVGKDADLVVIDDNYEPIATYVEGRKVYDIKEDKGFFNEKFIQDFQIVS